MRITFINVGYGEAILIELNKQEPVCPPYTIMIDGGGNDSFEFEGFAQRIRAVDYLKNNGIKKIDLLINTHIHEDHTCGLSDVVKQVEIGEFWCNYVVPEEYENININMPLDVTESQSKFIKAINSYNDIYFTIKRKGVPIRQTYGVKRDTLLQSGLSVDILGPSERDYNQLKNKLDAIYSMSEGREKSQVIAQLDAWMNMVSIMLRFHYHKVKIFLPSDVNCGGYGQLTNSMDLVQSDILKAAHHGQIDGITEELAMNICPKIVVTCASSDHRYNSSNPKTYKIIDNTVRKFGVKPIFLFSDDVKVKNYSEDIITHHAVVIEIDDKTSQLSCKYM